MELVKEKESFGRVAKTWGTSCEAILLFMLVVVGKHPVIILSKVFFY